jgi:hypothetical protein
LAVTRAVLALLAVLTGCSPAEDTTSCTELGCNTGLQVSFVFKDRGAYVFELDLDGQKTTCRATLPLADPPPQPCDRDGVFLGLSGSKLPADQHTIDGLTIPTTTVRHLTVKVVRDGVQVATLDRDVTYQVTPGPNGPKCEPRECRAAQLAL